MSSSRRLALLTVLFALGCAAGRVVWNHLTLPFHDPYGVVSQVTLARYNPHNNALRYGVFVALPVLFLLAAFGLNLFGLRGMVGGAAKRAGSFPEQASPWRLRIALLAAAALLELLIAAPAFRAARFDLFHTGEALASATAIEQGAAPYSGVFLAHGYFQDAGRGLLAFRLFGRSIDSLLITERILRMIGFALLAALLLALFRGAVIPAAAGLAVMMALRGVALLPQEWWLLCPASPKSRDIVTFTWLIAATLTMRHGAERPVPWKLAAGGFAIAFLPAAAMAYALDRALFSMGASLAAGALLLAILPSRRLRAAGAASLIAGAAAGWTLAAAILGASFEEFARLSFLVIPGYWEYMDGLIYPIASPVGLSGLMLIAACAYAVVAILVEHWDTGGIRRLARNHHSEITLLTISILMFRRALGRSDIFHIQDAAAPAYLLAFYLVVRYVWWGRFGPLAARLSLGAGPALAAVGLLTASAAICFYSGAIPNAFRHRVPDSGYVPGEMRAPLAFIRPLLKDGATFATLDNNPIWYYLLNRKPPIRFHEIWVAASLDYQREAARGLDRSRVDYVLYDSRCYTARMDGIRNSERFPLLLELAGRNYEEFANVDGYRFWKRKRAH